MRKILFVLVGLALAGLAVFWVVTAPETTEEIAIAGLEPDLARGEWVFHAGGCASCHAAPGSEGEDKLVLAGGKRFASDFGTFLAPNISPDPTNGIGNWTDIQLVNALRHGVSPDGAHYYPAFPYTAYANAELSDLVSLAAFLRTLPASQTPSQAHEVGFPFNIRRSLGGWKWLMQPKGWVIDEGLTPEAEAGRYLVEALGHCTECHTPRNALGGLNTAKWMGGAPIPGSNGRTPNITPGALSWSATDVAYYLETGFTPDFDSAGGEMAEVVENFAHLTPEDRAAVAAYLEILPEVAEN